MDSKQDYFRSPTPKNFENFYSPFRPLRNEDELLFTHSLLSPFNRNVNSSFSPYSPPLSNNDSNLGQFKVKINEPLNKKIQQRILFQGEEDQEMDEEKSAKLQTPQKNTINITNLQTTARKKYDLRMVQANQKVHLNKDGQKGLRALSRQAFQIFHHHPPMTYQQVAQRMIEENEELNDYPEVRQILKQKRKQKQSIKRRVYDALNVLIAVGILEKNGKKISLNKKKNEQKQKQTDEIKKLQEQIQKKANILQTKLKRLQQIKAQRQCIKRLLMRNSKMIIPQQKISFPFVIAKQFYCTKDGKSINLKGLVCADMDAILSINLEQNKN